MVVIDDDPVILLSCERILRKAGYRVETFDSSRAGLGRLERPDDRPALLVVDLKMPEPDGFQVIARAREIDPDLVVVVITGYATVSSAVDAMKAGAYDFLPKPFTPDELRLIARRAWERWCLVQDARRLRREKEEAERRFITLVSHQLKTPLAAVQQYLDVLLHTARGDLPERAKDWIERSRGRIAEMLALIHDWLTLARVERGAMCERSAATDLRPVVAQVLEAVRPQAEAARVEVSAGLPPDLPAVAGDAAAVGTVVANLVGNAVKYNRPGGTVRVTAAAGPAVQLAVTDTGLGIPAASLPQLFREFHRVRTPATQDIPGTGLGLAIVRRIVTELGGTIEVESREGEGSTFRVTLPAAAPRAEGTP